MPTSNALVNGVADEHRRPWRREVVRSELPEWSMSTAGEERLDLVGALARLPYGPLKSVHVPRRIDSSVLVAAGQRRLLRRRTAGVGAFAAVGLAGSGIVAGVDWSAGNEPAPTVATGGRTGQQQEQWDTFSAAIEDRVWSDLTWPYAMGESDPNGTIDAMPLSTTTGPSTPR